MQIWKAFRLACGLAACGLVAAELSPNEYLGYVKFLSSQDMRGRATGSPELERAAAFIQDKFRSLGLRPLHAGSYFQDFEVTTSARLGTQNQLAYGASEHRKKTLKFQQDFIPLNLSTDGNISG